MKTILVPTDFSLTADNALQFAIKMAAFYGMDLHLLHVTQMTTITSPDAVYLEDFSQLKVHDVAKMETLVAEIKNENPKLQITSNVEIGILLDSIQNACNEIKPILTVMGITGSNAMLDKIIGSNVIDAIERLKSPILVVPKKAVFQPFKDVCFACDLHQVATTTPIISFKVFMKLFTGSKLNILNIDFKNKHFTPNTPNEIAQIEDLFDNINYEFHFIENENIQDGIDAFVEQKKMDLLIMVPQRHSFFEKLFRKSQTKEMVYHSHIPLLSLHQ